MSAAKTLMGAYTLAQLWDLSDHTAAILDELNLVIAEVDALALAHPEQRESIEALQEISGRLRHSVVADLRAHSAPKSLEAPRSRTRKEPVSP